MNLAVFWDLPQLLFWWEDSFPNLHFIKDYLRWTNRQGRVLWVTKRDQMTLYWYWLIKNTQKIMLPCMRRHWVSVLLPQNSDEPKWRDTKLWNENVWENSQHVFYINSHFMQWCASILFSTGLIRQIEIDNYINPLFLLHCIALWCLYDHPFAIIK